MTDAVDWVQQVFQNMCVKYDTVGVRLCLPLPCVSLCLVFPYPYVPIFGPSCSPSLVN